MSITVTSTTDSAEDVLKAQGSKTTPDAVKSEPAEKLASETPKESEPLIENESKEDEEKDSDDEKSEDKPQKKKGGYKRRIDKLITRLSAADQEAQFWRQEALKKQGVQEKAEKPVEPLRAEGKPKSDDFESHEAYVEALADWKVDQKLSAREQKAKESDLKTEQQKQVSAHVDRVQVFAKEHEDFNDLMESVNDIPMSITVQEVILGSEIGPELMYALAKEPEEYKKICKMPALQAARELGKIEARLSKNSSTETPELKTTKAPKPINPVGSKPSAASTKSPDQMSFQEFKRWRQQHPNG